jgi:hypothetical protein
VFSPRKEGECGRGGMERKEGGGAGLKPTVYFDIWIEMVMVGGWGGRAMHETKQLNEGIEARGEGLATSSVHALIRKCVHVYIHKYITRACGESPVVACRGSVKAPPCCATTLGFINALNVRLWVKMVFGAKWKFSNAGYLWEKRRRHHYTTS